MAISRTLAATPAPEEVFADVEGLAAGAMLTVITQTMMPEALQHSGGLAAVGGFLFHGRSGGLTAI